MSLQTESELLETIPLFRNVDPAKRKLVAMSSERLIYAPGEIVFEQDTDADAVYLMLSGRVKILRQDAERAVEIADLKGSAVIGEVGVVCGRKRGASVRAIDETTMLRIDGQVFNELLEQVPQVTLALLKELADRLEATNDRLFAATKPAGN